MIKAIIFDFDATLVDYMKSDFHAMNAVADILPKIINPRELWEKSGDILVDIYEQNITGSDIHRERSLRTIASYNMEWREEYITTY